MSNRLKSALMEEEESVRSSGQEVDGRVAEEEAEEDEIVTTEEEMEGFRIVRAIMREVVSVERIAPRDVRSYFGILLDDNNRKPICRLRFNASQSYIGLFDEKKNEERVPINSLDELYNYADRLRATAGYYDDDA